MFSNQNHGTPNTPLLACIEPQSYVEPQCYSAKPQSSVEPQIYSLRTFYLIRPNVSRLNEILTQALDPPSHCPLAIESVNLFIFPSTIITPLLTTTSTSPSYPPTSSTPLPTTTPHSSSRPWPQLPAMPHRPSASTSSPPPLPLSPYHPPSPYCLFLPL